MNDEQAIEYVKEKKQNKDKINDIWLETRAFKKYLLNVRKGKWNTYVPEFEERLRNKIKKNKGEIKTMEKHTSRYFNSI